MTFTTIKFLALKVVAVASIASIASIATTFFLASAAHAQQVYRSIGGDGKVTFSDKPPPASDTQAKITYGAGGSGAGVAPSPLPFELRQITAKYPVTLYTSDNCTPCVSAKSLLISRGIPFSEKTVKTMEDNQALLRLSGDNNLPFATIGSQQLKGFSDAEWTQFLNAAGYPVTSVLPTSYRQPPATPFVAVTTAPAVRPITGAGNSAPARPDAPAPQDAPAGNNPAGIKF